ncbi:PaaI family thioesterase [Meridianimarinicoccus sp. RP-17]|uniref:PaaI family thioesterase n=1 Tax=Meridianimarinicoccus zhengii TaxID=2056810 RepID=UPI001F3AA5C7|nr:PaaI family thioesterase [Phycocomes zhengii]
MHDLKMDMPALRAFLDAEFPQVAGALDLRTLSPGRLDLVLRPDDSHLRPGGTVSGPTMFMLADVGVYLAVLALVGPRALAVTTGCSMDFLRKPSADKTLLAEIEILKCGRRLAVGDARLTSGGAEGPLVARGTLTYFIP